MDRDYMMESVEALRREVTRLTTLIEIKDKTIKELADTFGKDKKNQDVIVKIINTHKIKES